MNILIATDFFHPDSPGGANKYIYYLARGLAKRGHNVSLITRKSHSALPEHEPMDGFNVYRYSVQAKNDLAFLITSLYRSIQLYKRLLQKNEFDIILIHQPLTGFGPAFYHLSEGSKKVYIFQSPWHKEYEIKAEEIHHLRTPFPLYRINLIIRRLIEKMVINRCNKIVVLSDFMRRELKNIHKVKKNLICKIPGGVDTGLFVPAEDRDLVRGMLGLNQDLFVLLCVRNLRPRMGIENLLKGMVEVLKVSSNICLVIGGRGPMEKELKRLSRRLGLGSAVYFTGFIPEEKLVQYYQVADYFVLPTRALEGFGLVTLEAMACGTPVLGTPVGATPEILEKFGQGFLFPGIDPIDISRLIIQKFRLQKSDPLGYKRLRKRCRDFVLNGYDWDDIIERWEDRILRN